jgi:hypothetical protein
MGSSSSSQTPNTEKIYKDDSCEYYRYGVCEMQGWRPYMVL